MGITNCKGKTQAVEKDDKGLVLEGSSHQKKAFVKKNSGSSNSISQEKNIHSVIFPKLPHSGSSDFKAVDKNVTNNQGPYLDDGDYSKKKKKLKKKKNSGSEEKPKHYHILPPLPPGSCDFKDDGVYSKHKTKSTKKESGVSNSVLQKKNEHPDILPELLHSGSSDFKTSDKTETNEPVPFSDEGVYFKNENKFTKKKSGVSDSELQGKNKQSDTLPTLSQSGSLDFIAGDENDTNNPGSFLNDGGYYTKKESGGSNSILQETSKHSDHGENETNNPELEDKLETYHSSDEEPAIIRLTLAAYKKTFHPETIEPNKPLYDVLKEVFKLMNTTEVWQEAKYQICESIRYNKDGGKIIRLIDSCKTQHAFFKAVINLYTREDFDLYAGVNMALRRQRSDDFKPTSEDLAFGPYVLVLQTLLWFWNELEYESSITYRKMILSEDDLDKYQKGISFTWLSFVSSSVNRRMAISFRSRVPGKQKNIKPQLVLFIFDNTNAGQCQPKNVQKFADAVEEEERVYAAGSRFCVTSRKDYDNAPTEIYLQVISN